jgi:fido (protein-threonine AMPylation protein)
MGLEFNYLDGQTPLRLEDVAYWYENHIYSPDEVAVRFKHQLVSIHCFANGNGRHSRLMADLIMEKLYKEPFLTWGGSSFVKSNEKREEYINAIKLADHQNFRPLIMFAKS